MAESRRAASENVSIPQTLIDDGSRTRQSPTVACAHNDHPLFVSDDVPADHLMEDIETYRPEALASTSELASSAVLPPDTAKANNTPDDFECILPQEYINKLPDSLPYNSALDFDSEGQELGSSVEDGLHRDFTSHNTASGISGSSLLSNGFEEFRSALADMPQISENMNDISIKQPTSKTEVPPTAISSGQSAIKSDVSSELILSGNVGSRVPQRTDGQRSKVFSPPAESGKKSKTKPENSGNNLVFAYRKDAEEIEIREQQASEDSHSSSDVDVDPLDRENDFRNDLNESVNSANSNQQTHNKNSGKSEDKKPAKKTNLSWGFVLNPNYKFRHDEFKRIFRNIPRSDRLIVDYSCALQKNILVQGRLYISQNWICFYACIFGVETTVSITFKDITHITKEKTALVFPNAIQISTKDEKHFFSSLNARDKTYLIISYFWKCANSQQPMSQEEMWSWIHYSYGDDLGVSCEDLDYIPLPPAEKAKHFARIDLEATMYQDVESLGTSVHAKRACGDDDDTLSAEPATKSSNPGLLSSGPNDINEAEIQCTGHEHFPIHVCDEVLDFSVNQLFDYCFSNSQVYRQFTEIKKTTDLVISEWPKAPAADGELVRNLTYTLSLNLAMTSKKAPATEKQTMYPSSKPGQIYSIDSECHTPTIPYGDSFYVVNRYCLTRVSESKSRLRITSQLVYQKNVFFKSFIEKNATSGILETFKILVTLLQKESVGKGSGDRDLPSTNPVTSISEQSTSKAESAKSAQIWEYCIKNVGSPKLLILLILVLVVMMVLIIKFFYSDAASDVASDVNVCSIEQKASYELIHKLQEQLYQQQVEIERWKTEHVHMTQTMDELRNRIAELTQQKHL